MRQQRIGAAVVMPDYLRLYPDYGPGVFVTTTLPAVGCSEPATPRGDMPEQNPPAGPALLTAAEVDRRKRILRLLQDALSAQWIVSALVGRRILLLCSEQSLKPIPGYGETVRPCDPQLYVFAGE